MLKTVITLLLLVLEKIELAFECIHLIGGKRKYQLSFQETFKRFVGKLKNRRADEDMLSLKLK